MSKHQACLEILLRRLAWACFLGCVLFPAPAAAQAGLNSLVLTDIDNARVLPGLERVASPQQEPPQSADPAQQPDTGVLVTVRGVVMNAASGEPLPRALVKLEGDLTLGAMTDGEGRFEIPGVPEGLQTLDVVKPGFHGKVHVSDFILPVTHTARVVTGMPELQFSLAPDNALYGKVTLSTGDPGVGIGLTLLRQTIQDGHASWREIERHQSTPEGDFRFSGLEDGTYLLMTQPTFDNDRDAPPSCDQKAPAEVPGYPVMFYGGSADLDGAARIALAGGQAVQANLVLTLAALHAVEAVPTKVPAGAQWHFNSALLDHSGLRLEYPVRENVKDHSLCAFLPDGTYTLTIDGEMNEGVGQPGRVFLRQAPRARQVTGMIDFGVDGRSPMRLGVPLTSGVATPIHFRYEPDPPKPQVNNRFDGNPEGADPDPDPMQFSVTLTNGIAGRGDSNLNASRVSNDLYELDRLAPGGYWIEAATSRSGICLGSVTAGGQSMGHTPWTAGQNGTGEAIDVVLRTDCAKLTLQLPAGLLGEGTGEAPAFYLYVVPEFDSVGGVHDGVVQTFAERSETLEDLTPGTYRVVSFDTPQQLEYRKAGALDRLHGQGQEVTLPPGGSVNLVLEIPTK
jgi:hypothetical protein